MPPELRAFEIARARFRSAGGVGSALLVAKTARAVETSPWWPA